MTNEMEFVTIKQEAKKYGLVREWRLRQLLKEGKLPGYYAGSRFYINHPALVEWLKEQTSANVSA